MKFHKQLIVDKGRGDCFRTCMACILDRPVLDIPNFTELALKCRKKVKPDMWHYVTKWSNENGLGVIRITRDNYAFSRLDYTMLDGTLCIGSIASQRFEFGYHAVVCQAKRSVNSNGPVSWIDIVHDPSPSNGPYPWYAELQALTFFTTLRPKGYLSSVRQAYVKQKSA